MSDDRSFDDCYFYFYSTCTKGNACPFRHCEAALGTEAVCSSWREGNCPRKNCKFRHMENRKNRHSIPCYWENQPGGCRKPHCVFLHMKTRHKIRKLALETPVKLILPVFAQPENSTTKLSNLQVSELLKTNDSELLPNNSTLSPLIEPVVVSIDEESDNESTSNTPIKSTAVNSQASTVCNKTITQKKHVSKAKSSQDIDLGIKTLEQIRLEKVHRESAHIYTTENQATSTASNVAVKMEDLSVPPDLRSHLKRKHSDVSCTLRNHEDVPKKRAVKLKRPSKLNPTQDETVDSTEAHSVLDDKNIDIQIKSNRPTKRKVLRRPLFSAAGDQKCLDNISVPDSSKIVPDLSVTTTDESNVTNGGVCQKQTSVSSSSDYFLDTKCEIESLEPSVKRPTPQHIEDLTFINENKAEETTEQTVCDSPVKSEISDSSKTEKSQKSEFCIGRQSEQTKKKRNSSGAQSTDDFDALLLDNDTDLILYPEEDNMEKGDDELLQELEEIINS